MKKSISLKIGLLFFILMTIIELSLFFILYTNISNYQIDEVLEGLLSRGSSHRNVLEKKFDQSTLNHVALMETEAVTDVVITDNQDKILTSSSAIDSFQKELIQKYRTSPNDQGMIIEEQWKNSPYVATLSPIIINGELRGNVYMFSPSSIIRDLTSHLSQQFIFVMVLILVVTLVVVFTLSKQVTKPLIRMKEETEKLSSGETNVELSEHYNDELGVLAHSINRLAEELERMKKERNDFLSSIAHELRTPLTYLKGYADIASREQTDEEDRRKYLEIIKEETESLTAMVQQLFQLAKMDENAFAIQPEVREVKPLLFEAKEKMYPLITNNEAEVSIDCSDGIDIYADPIRFRQVIMNLLDNALRYSGEQPRIHIQVNNLHTRVLIKVRDEGSGVPEEFLPYLFDRLYRIDKSRSRGLGGTGLGLAIVKEIVEIHGGKVEAMNQEGLCIQVSWPKEGSL
ncbi:sensor histidine kinase [Sediminibacillus terrae]|uniref:sensor histidine kinase n=1 Tax=Sediminibacillus terrae TaxID=1562106 RepID=UPI0012970323|nr:HAMP domain-containing sensor histidine kinase [Sediminibacillus terrae]